jgi:hypothetical protein
MLKPRNEMLEMLEELIDQYSAFQRSWPDLPEWSLCDLAQDELELVVAEFRPSTPRASQLTETGLPSVL